jgi:hypothetical protein
VGGGPTQTGRTTSAGQVKAATPAKPARRGRK